MSLGPDSIRLWEHHIGDVPTAVWVPLRPFIFVRQSVCLQPPQHESMLAETTMPHFGTSRLLWRPSLTSQIARLPYMTRNYRADTCRLFKCQERGRIRVEGGDRGGETEKNWGWMDAEGEKVSECFSVADICAGTRLVFGAQSLCFRLFVS